MQYQQALKLLYNLSHKPIRNRVEQLSKLLTKVGNPHQNFKVVHITGTCGKGSVTTKCTNFLVHSGYRTGMMTSPHILDYCERVQVDFQMISPDYVAEWIPRLIELAEAEHIQTSFAILNTALAFCYFRDQQVDWAVVEVGAGGTSDPSNIVDPEVSVITSVGLDHCRVFGNTIEAIATEKSGVIKEGKPCVLGPNTPHQMLCEIAQKKHSPVHIVPSNQCSFDTENQNIARTIADVLRTQGWNISAEAVDRGVVSKPPLRYQKVKVGESIMILDVAHNGLGLNALFHNIKQDFPMKQIRTILGISTQKNPAEYLEVARLYSDYITLAWDDHAMLIKEDKLSAYQVPVAHLDTLLDISELSTPHNQVTVICGSFYLLEATITKLSRLGISIPLTWTS